MGGAAVRDVDASAGGRAEGLGVRAGRTVQTLVQNAVVLDATDRLSVALVQGGAPALVGLVDLAATAGAGDLTTSRHLDAGSGLLAVGLVGSAERLVQADAQDAVPGDAVGGLRVALFEGRTPALVRLVDKALTALVPLLAAGLDVDAGPGRSTVDLVSVALDPVQTDVRNAVPGDAVGRLGVALVQSGAPTFVGLVDLAFAATVGNEAAGLGGDASVSLGTQLLTLETSRSLNALVGDAVVLVAAGRDVVASLGGAAEAGVGEGLGAAATLIESSATSGDADASVQIRAVGLALRAGHPSQASLGGKAVGDTTHGN